MLCKTSAFPLFQPFRQWEFWLERIPGPLPDMAQIFCGSQGHPRKREWSVSWALRSATQASAGCQSKPRAGNGTKRVKMVRLSRPSAPRALFPHSRHSESGCSASHRFGAAAVSPVTRAKMGPALRVCLRALQKQIEDELRDGGKLAAGGRLASKSSRDWKLSCCNNRLWNRCGTH